MTWREASWALWTTIVWYPHLFLHSECGRVCESLTAESHHTDLWSSPDTDISIVGSSVFGTCVSQGGLLCSQRSMDKVWEYSLYGWRMLESINVRASTESGAKTNLPVWFRWLVSGLSSHPIVECWSFSVKGVLSREKLMVKLISYHSGIASMLTHIYNPGIHMCTKAGQDLKCDYVSKGK